jgi:cytochrome c
MPQPNIALVTLHRQVDFFPCNERTIMKRLTYLLLASSMFVAGAVLADDALVAKHKCNTCHDVEKKKMGPSWKEVAAKHKGQKDAEAALAKAIVSGSKGSYGKIPMPPQPKAKDDAAALAKWILAH